MAVTLLVGCGGARPSSPTREDLRAIDVSPDHTITVDEDGYEPTTLEVTAGDVILLLNEGDEEHSFTAEEQRFDTGRMHPGDDSTLVLTEPGEVPFHDLEDPDHEGLLTVVARG
ncbi:MAG: cupredoxin domain-containing protein [Actinomycetota bacterium]|nr:cupredoxin domain-containing protein [Actinomycetota bacterium]